MRKFFSFLWILTIMTPLFAVSPTITYGAETNKMIQVGAGGFWTVFLDDEGSLWTFEEKESGGIGTMKILDQVQSISIGDAHGMAIKKDGSLWGWGNNDYGQLGNNSFVSSTSPVKILDHVATVSAGKTFTLAVKEDGSLWGWGDNGWDCIRYSDEAFIPIPTKMIENVKTAVAGHMCSYILKKDDTLWAQGRSRYATGSPTEGAIQIGSDMKAIFANIDVNYENVSANDLLCLKNDDSLWAWKVNITEDNSLAGRLVLSMTGQNKYVTTLTPEKISDNVTTADYRGDQIGFVKKDGTLWSSHQYGYPPEKILEDVTSFALGYEHGVAVKTDGTLWGWGESEYGQLGLKNPNAHPVPQEVSVGNNISKIFAKEDSIYFLKEDHTLWTYQYNQETNTSSLTKVMDRVKDFRYGDYFSTLLTDDQTLYLIGHYYDEGPNWETSIPLMDQVAGFDAQSDYICAVTTDGSLWFYNLYDYDYDDLEGLTPEKLDDNLKDAAINIEYDTSSFGVMGIKTDGTLLYYRFLDNDSESPEEVLEIATDVSSVATTPLTCAFIKTDGSLWIWSYNWYGEAGTGTDEPVPLPTKIMDNVTSFYLADDHTMAIKKDGSLWAWGNNDDGQLGTGTTRSELFPVKIMEGVQSVGPGATLTSVLKTDGTLWFFGYDKSELFLGENVDTYYHDPIEIKIS